MGRGSAISHSTTPPPNGARTATDSRARERDPWTPSSSRDLIAALALIAVLMAILIVYTHDVPQAPRKPSWDPVPWARTTAPVAPADWSAVPLTPGLAELGPNLAKPLGARLERSRAALSRCLAEADGPGDAAEVVLRLAPRSTALHVEGIEGSDADTPQALLECARHVLEGDAIPAQGVVPGRRYRVRVALR